MDKLRRMEIFVAVVQAKQFTRAAKNLGLSKSAVSQAINDLEMHLGVQLIERGSSSFELSQKGEVYFKKSKFLLEEIHRLNDEISDTEKELSGRIKITAPIKFGAERIGPVIAEFMSLHPDVQIDVELSDGKLDLLKEGVDIAIRISNLKDSAHISRKLTNIEMNLCASPAFIKENHKITDVEDLSRVNCLKYGGTPVWYLIKNGKEYEFAPKGNVTSNSGETLAELTIAGKGVAYLPEFLFNEPHEKGQLTRLLPSYSGKKIGVYALFPSVRHQRRSVRALLDFIIDAFKAEKRAADSATILS